MKQKKRTGSLVWAVVLAGLIAAASIVYFNMNQGPSVRIFFIKGEALIAVRRALPPNMDPLKIAAEGLMAGPNEKEKAQGIFTEIPKGAKILKAERKGGETTVAFSEELEHYGGGSARVQGLVAQIVYTFTDIPGSEKVKIMVGKRASVVLGGEGFVIDRALSREDVKL